MAGSSTARPPRVVVLTDRPPDEGDGRFVWMLFAANNRPLARAAVARPTLQRAREDARRVRDAVPSGAQMLVDLVDGRWAWTLRLGRTVAVHGARTYLRRVECTRAAQHFLTSIGLADPDTAVLRYYGPRTLRGFDGADDTDGAEDAATEGGTA